MTTRRAFLQTAAAPALLRAQTRSKPNILFLMSDQHRFDCMGNAGNPAAITPNMDRLAREGTRFTAGYTSTPSCTPARSGILTGCSPWKHGMLGYGRGALKYPIEMPQALRDAGYYTMGIGKMHWNPQRNIHGFHQVQLYESGRAESPEFRSDYRAWFWSQAPNLNPDATGIGWNDFDAKPYVLPEALHPTTWTANVAVNFLKDYQRPEPFFLKVSFSRPHSPYDPPQRWWDRYADARLPEARSAKWAERYIPRSGDTPHIWHGELGAAQVRKSRQGYYGSVSFVDEQIGRILEALEKRGMLEETLIVYASDHGDMTGDHHMWRKSYAYEASAHIPMLLRRPGTRGATVTRAVELRDLLPTFLEAAGRPTDERCDGVSLTANSTRQIVDLEHDVCYNPSNHWSALTDGKTKYIYHARDGEEQLFDLTQDPYELNDISGTEAVRPWRSKMLEHLAVRGEKYVQNGKLALRPKANLYSPNFPKPAA